MLPHEKCVTFKNDEDYFLFILFSKALVASLLLVVRPGAPSSVLL